MNQSGVAGKIALVTGSTDGLGRALAGRLAAAGASVIVHGRNLERIDVTVRELRERNPEAQIFCYRADLASLDETRTLASAIEADFPRVDLLVTMPESVPARRAAVEKPVSMATSFALQSTISRAFC